MEFTNVAHIVVTESAAATLTFKKLETGISVMEKVAWIIHRLEYYLPSVTSANFNGDSDALQGALCAANTLADLEDMSNPALLDMFFLRRIDLGVAASGTWFESPKVKDFAGFPGGGLLIPPNPLYAALKGTGTVAAMTMRLRIFYSPVTLKTEEFWQLVEAYRVISS